MSSKQKKNRQNSFGFDEILDCLQRFSSNLYHTYLVAYLFEGRPQINSFFLSKVILRKNSYLFQA